MLYAVKGKRGELEISQPSLESAKNGRNDWDVKLSDRIPIDLNVTSGPGNATLSLSTLRLKTLTVAAGPGNVSIDAGSPSLKIVKITAGPGNLSINLSAPWKHNVSAIIDGGVGNTTVSAPALIGVRVAVHGLGHVNAPGFTRQGDAYINSEYGRSKFAVRIVLKSGIGNVNLRTES